MGLLFVRAKKSSLEESTLSESKNRRQYLNPSQPTPFLFTPPHHLPGYKIPSGHMLRSFHLSSPVTPLAFKVIALEVLTRALEDSVFRGEFRVSRCTSFYGGK